MPDNTRDFVIDEHFTKALAHIGDEALALLERSILLEGVREPLLLWHNPETQEDVLIDGHHRHTLCMRHGIDFETDYIGEDLKTRDEVITWMYRNQLGRRNLTPDQATIIRGRLYNQLKQSHGAESGGRGNQYTTYVKTPLSEGDDIGLLTESDVDEIIDDLDRQEVGVVSDQIDHLPNTSEVLAREYGVSQATIRRDGVIASALDERPEMAEKVLSGAMKVAEVRRELAREKVVEKLEDVQTIKAKEIEGVYDVIVVDPPWDIQKIARDVAPDQVGLDYPTMAVEEIAGLKIPCHTDCHVFLWTTQKYLPDALELLKRWGMTYVLTFVWHKPGGFQPFNLPQYNCEFALYAKVGNPVFIDFKQFFTCFNAERGAHSEKPEYFYEVLRRVTRGRRLDMFNRRDIEGFDGWGNESQSTVSNGSGQINISQQ